MSAPKVFVVGGTGAQGIPVIRGLVKDRTFSVKVLTRDTTSKRAQQLLALGNVELLEGTFASEADLRTGFSGCDYAFVNIDGFNSGEKTEIFWAIRAYELAFEAGIKFFVYGNLDFVYKKSGYDSKFRSGHYDGKGRIGEWILDQNRTNQNRMRAALFTTGPYIEMTIAARTVMTPKVENGVVTWRVPLGDGAVCHVALDDCEHYVRWLFDHQDRANGMDLEVAIGHIPYVELAAAFENVTGHPARYIDESLDEYWKTGPMAPAADAPCGYNSNLADPAAMNIRTNFTGFWNMWKYSGGNGGVIKRDYALLDEIHPNRIRTAEEWFRREEKRGIEVGLGSLWERVNNPKPTLKIVEDGAKGRL
ncbi:NAD(P)-binding protein [Trichodelitschia bisporula]|uniref:NAD(P)-binding protein n=1 Tax=Trichodelitschia bisporula TaxID=703511 RepID=A0A6G1IAE0_9PEZI|nr:NAD(P)-binding protein [Trichodelitschia bisporula]